MSDKRAIILCLAADAAAAEYVASQYPGGAGSFGPGASRWSTVPGAPVSAPTHLAVSGSMPEDMVEALRSSSLPIFMVIDNPDDLPVEPQLLALEPPLHKCVESEEA